MSSGVWAARSVKFSLLVLAWLVLSDAPGEARAQDQQDAAAAVFADDFLTGKAAQAWQTWTTALEAVLNDNMEQANEQFGALLEQNVSPLRLALLEKRSVVRGVGGGALLLLEQDAEAGNLTDNTQRIWDLLEIGREQLNLADDAWYFASIGRFPVANANFEALLAQQPDPVALLEFTDSVPERHEILLQLAGNPIIGENVRAVMDLLREGERQVKADPIRIRYNIERLGGTPRAYQNATDFLQDSGEYAVPFLIEALRDPAKQDLTQQITEVLPKLDRPGIEPLVAALDVPDESVKVIIIEALAAIGYPQVIPYLLAIESDADASTKVQATARDALETLRSKGVNFPRDLRPADAMFHLAELYYDNHRVVAADARFEVANVWYWRDDILQNIPVTTEIYNEVMAMRTCRRALELDPEHKPAIALWLAGNFRRVAQLGDDEDPTRPEGFPTADYFAQSAGSEYCQLTLSRAVTDRDPAVALGAIQALRKTAGRASLLGGPDSPQPLAEALAFPNRMVRIRAGLALAFARPTEAFRNYQNLMPVLSETLNLHAGARSALIVEPNDQIANDVAAALRAEGYEVSIDSNLSSGLRVAREQMTGTDVIFLGSDISDPNLEGALQTIQSDFQFAATPVVIITKKGDQPVVEPLVRENAGTAMIQPNESASEVVATVGRVSSEIGYTPVGPQQGRELAAEAIEALRLLALTSNTLFEPVKAQTALLSILESDDPDLRIAAAEVLSMLSTADAQQALAATAFNSDEQPFIRSTMFARLADSAKRFGNRLSEAQIETLVAFVISDGPSMELREAASQALGALSVPGNPASRIIRQQTGP